MQSKNYNYAMIKEISEKSVAYITVKLTKGLFQNIKIHTWLQSWGVWNKRNCIKIKGWLKNNPDYVFVCILSYIS